MRTFATDERLAYRRAGNELQPRPSEDHVLSYEYRLMQLPLVRPDHPEVVPFDLKAGYDWLGTYRAPRVSLVGFVDFGAFAQSPQFNRFMNAVAMTAAARKIAWDLVERRKYRHHFTICNGLHERMPAQDIVPFVKQRLEGFPRFRVQVKGGWFWGKKNGRIYFPVYPELTEGPAPVDHLTEVQKRLGHSLHPGFYIGCLQLMDHLRFNAELDVHEADELFGVLRSFRETVIVELEVNELSILRTHDDLILKSRVLDRVPLAE
ncbi:hypothetical protein HV824_11485 [Myxococcus sp. AM009]|uniref:hypothetical protein n=1 Tax=unclassified Myxococcus TaxID=2648731 RepID=UPI0015952CD3|nr:MULTISPECIES: hypothetical protein [unclassified Myxococcus]NVI98738.1 hypothetical protein [Myxococcus sp. AM009]NVJ15384.1 hypothetical protein [Myxococcus sp. AM010]